MAAPKRIPTPETNGNPRPQTISAIDNPIVESRHHSVSETIKSRDGLDQEEQSEGYRPRKAKLLGPKHKAQTECKNDDQIESHSWIAMLLYRPGNPVTETLKEVLRGQSQPANEEKIRPKLTRNNRRKK